MKPNFHPIYWEYNKSGHLYYTTHQDDKIIKIAQVCYRLEQNKEAEVYGLINSGADDATMLELSDNLHRILSAHGVRRAHGYCAYHLGLHYERTYGWSILGAPDFEGNVLVERWLQSKEV